MIINKLKLHNFLSHDDTEIIFEKGVNIIIGKNGAGKSSIIDGMKFAFLGEKRGSKIEDLVKRGKMDCSVSMDFTIGNKSYSITRKMVLGRRGEVKERDAILLADGVEVSRQVTGVNSAIEDPNFIGINKEVFINSVFVEQGEIDALVSKTKADREKVFGKIVGLDVLSKYAEDLRDLKRELEIRKSALSGVREQLESLKEEKSKKEQERTGLFEKLNIAKLKLKDEQDNLAAAEKSRDDLRSKIAFLESDEKELKRKVEKHREISDKIGDLLSEKQKLSDQLKEIEKDLDPTLMDKEERIREFISKNQEGDLIADKINRVKQDVKEYRDLSRQLKELEGPHNEFEMLKESLLELEKEADAIRDSWNTYEQDKEILKKEDEKIEQIKRRISQRKAEIYNILGIEPANTEQISRIERDVRSNVEELSRKKSELMSRREGFEEQIKTLENKIDSISGIDTCPLCQQPITDEHRERILSDYKSQQNTLRRSLEAIDQQLKKTEDDLGALKNRTDLIDGKNWYNFKVDLQNINDSRINYGKLQRDMQDLEKDHGRYDEIMQQISAKKTEARKIENLNNYYTALKISISSKDIQAMLKEEEELTRQMQDIKNYKDGIIKEIGFEPNPKILERIKSMKSLQERHRDISNHMSVKTIELEKSQEELNPLAIEIESLKGRVSLKPQLSVELEESDMKKSELEKAVEKALSDKTELDSRIRGLESQISEIDDQILNLQNRRDEFYRLSEAITRIEKLRVCFDRDGIQKSIRKDSAEFLTIKVMDYADSFNLNFDDVRVNDDMNIEISQNGHTESVDMLSGGEKTALSIALRLALAKYVMENIKTMIMDEPTTYLDQDRRNNLKDIIQYTFSSENTPVPQMIIVTHHTDLYTAADNVLEVVKENGTSKVSSVI